MSRVPYIIITLVVLLIQSVSSSGQDIDSLAIDTAKVDVDLKQTTTLDSSLLRQIEVLHISINLSKDTIEMLKADSMVLKTEFKKYLKKKKEASKVLFLNQDIDSLNKIIMAEGSVFSELDELMLIDSIKKARKKDLAVVQSDFLRLKENYKSDSLELLKNTKSYEKFVSSTKYASVINDYKLLFGGESRVVTKNSVAGKGHIDDAYVKKYLEGPYDSGVNNSILESYSGRYQNVVRRYCEETIRAAKFLKKLNERESILAAKNMYNYKYVNDADKWKQQGYLYLYNQMDGKYKDLLSGLRTHFAIAVPDGCSN